MSNANRNTFKIATLALAVSGALSTLPGVANASYVECVSGQQDALCTVRIIDGLSLQTTVAEMTEMGANSYQLSGTVSVVTPAITFPLTDANLTVTTGNAPELYGDISLPLGSMPMLKDLGLDSAPSARIGFVQGDNVRSFLEDDDAELPLNDGISEGGTQRESNTPYFVFNFDSAIGFDVPPGKLLGAQGEQNAEDSSVLEALLGGGTMSFGMPASFSATAILDVADHYFYLSYDQDGIDLKSMVEDTFESIEGGPTVYNVDDENGERSLIYTVDENTGTVTEQNLKNGKTVHYQSDANGDYRQQGGQENPVSLPSDFFDRHSSNKDRKNGDSDGGDKKDRSSAMDFIDAIGFSMNGWIPFKAPLPTDTDSEFDISGQLFLSGSFPLPYKAGEIDGDVVVYYGEYGYAVGGEGELSLEMPGVPDFLGLSLKLGEGTAGLKMTQAGQQLFIDGTLDPEETLLDYLPMRPTGNGRVTGYIGNDLENSQISIKGAWGMNTSKIGELIGIEMSDIKTNSGEMSIGKDGIYLQSTTRMQLIPQLKIRGEMDVLFDLDWNNPEEFTLKMNGDIILLGHPLASAEVLISQNGMFINSQFVTPFVSMDMSGEITAQGPQLSGTGRLHFDLAQITQTIQEKHKDVAKKQAEVNRLEGVIADMRRQVRSERAAAQRELAKAQAEVRKAQAEISSLDREIAGEQRKINNLRNEIRNLQRWAAQGSFWEFRDAQIVPQIGWKELQIKGLEAGKAGLIIAKAAANEVMNAARGSLAGIRAGMDWTPIDADIRVAGPIAAKKVAWEVLEVARKALKDFPQIDASVYGDLSLSIGYQGLSGSVSVDVNGNRLNGRVTSHPYPQACITIGDLGEACAKIAI